jgi:hypothetical protein
MSFFFCITNPGLETQLKYEMAQRFPSWRLSFSAPGFITFKGEGAFPDRPYLARYWGECVGKGEVPGCKVIRLEKGGVWSVKIHTPHPYWDEEHKIAKPKAEKAPSRAWLKIEEVIDLFNMTFDANEKVIELGAAPGGAVLNLLERGLTVVGVDPAQMDQAVVGHPRFTHLRKPFQMLLPSDFAGVSWWLSDLNLAPGTVLSHLGRLLREAPTTKGLVLTMKIFKPEIALEFSMHEKRVQDWGYRTIVRLLPSHHQEVVLVALKKT